MLISAYHAVVFDLDGTLVDSRPDIVAAANHALLQCGLSARPEQQVVSAVGDGAYKLLERLSGFSAGSEALHVLYRHFAEWYLAHPCDCTTLYPDAVETLQTLQRAVNSDDGTPVLLALCTNKPRDITLALLDRLKLRTYFSVITAGDDFTCRKPHPEPLLYIARTLDVLPGKMLMVGDGPQDVLCGRAAGAVTVGVQYGFKPLELRKSGPDFFIPSLNKLTVLKGFSQ